jgi:pimeloyl-ACP methyl ester carboxylesterase
VARAALSLMLSTCVLFAGGAGFVRKQIPTDEGRVSYEVRGGGSGPGLILIPGSFHDNREWEACAASEWNIPLLLVELRGHGGSWPPPANGSSRVRIGCSACGD